MGWELEIEFKLIDPRLEASFAAECNLIMKQRHMAVTGVLGPFVACNLDDMVAGNNLAGCRRLFQDAHKAMKSDSEMGNPDRLYDGKNDDALDDISW